MRPNERIFLDKFYQLCGHRFYGDKWNEYALYFLNSKSPDLTALSLPSDKLEKLMESGEGLNKMAVKNAFKVEAYLIKHGDRVYFTDNFKTSYEYHGEVLAYDFINSNCIDSDGKSHLCRVTLKPSSEFIDKKSIQLFDPNAPKSLQKNNKALLVSKAVLRYFDSYGIPASYKELIGEIQDGYKDVYGQNVREKMVYETISVMADFWINRSKNQEISGN